jgi:hypothetical protein
MHAVHQRGPNKQQILIGPHKGYAGAPKKSFKKAKRKKR